MSRDSIRQRLHNRIMRWALRRQGADPLPLTLTSRRVYILPTRAGWIFAVLIVVTFVAGMNYGNGLALLLTFWLTGFALVAMIQTQRTLTGSRILAISAAPTFAGSKIELRLQIDTRRAVSDLVASTRDDVETSIGVDATSADTPGELQLALPARRRGIWHAPVLRLESRAPFGMFRSWTWLQLEARTLIYPRPAGELPVPESPGTESGVTRIATGHDELAWLRPFREGDSPRQVAWKAYAGGAPLLVREYHGNAAATHDFDFSSLQSLDTESRLAQLCRWVVEADARGETWTLRMPGGFAASGAGSAHRQQCLEQLALFGLSARVSM